MFDEDSNSLWTTFEGVPVVGPLTGTGIPVAVPARRHHHLAGVARRRLLGTRACSHSTPVTRATTRRARPTARYFGTDALMFEVSRTDKRLKNKAEVLTLLLAPSSDSGSASTEVRRPLALSSPIPPRPPATPPEFRGPRPLRAHDGRRSQPRLRERRGEVRPACARWSARRLERGGLEGVRGKRSRARATAGGLRRVPGAARVLVRLVRAVPRDRARSLGRTANASVPLPMLARTRPDSSASGDSGAYAAAVFMVVATTMATPPLLLWSMRRSPPSAAS